MNKIKPPIDLGFPKVGDLIQWVNLLEVWSNDSWVDDGGPYFNIEKWEAKLVRTGIVIERSIEEGIFHWSVWDWNNSKFYHVSSTTDEIRILSRCFD
jgi:hypothetical protein